VQLTPKYLAFGSLYSTSRNSKLKFLNTCGAATTPHDQIVIRGLPIELQAPAFDSSFKL